MTEALPPLMRALRCADPPMEAAMAEARRGVDAGLIAWRVDACDFEAALVLAPDLSLRRAMAALPAAMLGLHHALGSLGPEDVPVMLGWAGHVFVQGARAGGFRVAASSSDPEVVPDWLVIGLHLALIPPAGHEGGERISQTTLAEEGLALPPESLLAGWARHALYWLNATEDDEGRAMLAREWHGLCQEIASGSHPGVDEDFGLLTRAPDGNISLRPLTTLLEPI